MTLRQRLHSFTPLVHNTRARQVGSLYAAFVINMGLGFVTSVLNTRMLGPAVYGDLRFINGTYQFLTVIATFGLFVTGSQMLAMERDNIAQRRGLIGGLLVISWIVSAIFIAITVVFAFVEPLIFDNQLTLVLIVFSPLLAVWIFQPCIEMILQGENDIHMLSFFRVMPGFLYMVLLLAFNLVSHPTLIATLLAQMLSGILTTIILWFRLKPDYSRFRAFVASIWEANKIYGLHVYVGILSGVATAYLSTFMISYYLNNTNVGYFSLALTLTMPLMQISSVVGTTYFKEFAQSDRIPHKTTVITVSMTLVSIVVFLILIEPLVLIVYSTKFLPVASLSKSLSVGMAFYGMGDYFNRFLGAHGKGRELRNGAIAVGLVNVLGYVILVKTMGVEGAAVTRNIAGAVYLGMMIYYYRMFRKNAGAPEALAVRVDAGTEAAE